VTFAPSRSSARAHRQMRQKHHYLPQFYLRNFVDPNSRYSGGPYLWQVDLATQSVTKRHPRNVAYIRGYNDWTSANQDVNSVETTYSRFESQAAPLIQSLIAGKYRATGQQRLAVAWFVALQISRVPSFRKSLEEQAAELVQADIDALFQGEQGLYERMIPSTSDDPRGAIVLDFRKVSDTEGEYTLVNAKDDVLIRSLAFSRSVAPLLYRAKWLTLIPPKDRVFLTSDTPVVFLATQKNRRSMIFYLPLSPRCMLVIDNTSQARQILSGPEFKGKIDPMVETMRIDKRMANELNRELLRLSESYVFTSSQGQARWVLQQRNMP
jgi:hypothetical protein